MRIILTFFSLLMATYFYAQSSLSFTYGVLPLEKGKKKTYDKILSKKIEKEMLKLGPAEAIPNYSIVARPELIIYSSDISATAPQYYTSDMELSITISDYAKTVTFGSYDIPIKGAGRTEEKSIANGVKGIKLGKKSFEEFLIATDLKILDYLKKKAPAILKEAKTILDSRYLANSKNQVELTLSRLGMLVHHNIKSDKAIYYIQEIKAEREDELCLTAKKNARLFLETNNFKSLYNLFEQYPFCSALVEKKDVEKRYDAYQKMRIEDQVRLDSLKLMELENDRRFKLNQQSNKSIGMDYLFESFADLFRIF